MRRIPALVATFIILAILVGSEVPQGGVSASAPLTAQTVWWNNSYQFRRPVTVVDSGSAPLVNQTVLLHLNFTGNDVEDATAGVRLVNASGAEVPSVVAGPEYSGFFLRSAYLLFVVNMPANSSASFYVYYGSSSTAVPSYRQSQPSASFSQGVVTVSGVPLSPLSSGLQLQFGSVDSESSMTRVSYTLGGPQAFGPSPISQQEFANDSGLVVAGQPAAGMTVAYQALQGGAIQLTRIVVLSGTSALTVDAVDNRAQSAVTGVQVASVIGLGGLTSSGVSSSAYDPGSNLLYTRNPDADFGVSLYQAPVSYTVGSTLEVQAEGSTGTFSGVSNYTLATAAGFSWTLGDMQPGGANWVSSGWGAASVHSKLVAGLPSAPIGAVVGAQQVQGVANPTGRSLWSAGAVITGLGIPSGGVSFPFAVKGGVLIAGGSSIRGTYAYTAPVSAQLDSRAWVVSSSSAGGATSFASPNSYDFGTGGFVDRLSLHVPSTSGTATASIISLPAYAYRGAGTALRVEYKASYSILSGNFSAQAIFVAADFDTTMRGNFNQTVLLPVTGSSTVVPSSGCSATIPPGGTAANTIYTSYLVGDGSWRTVTVPLPQSLPSTGFNIRLRVCTSSVAGFSGDMSLEVGSAGVVVSGPLSQIFSTSFSQAGPTVTLSYLPQAAPLAQAGVTANLTASLLLQANSTIGWRDGASFSGEVVSPTGFVLNTSAFRRVAVVQPPLFQGVMLGSAVSGYAESWALGSTPGNVSAGAGTTLLTVPSGTPVSGTVGYTVGLRGDQVSISVLDKSQKGVQGATVIPYTGGRVIPVTLTTGSSGAVSALLVPWTYQLNATYQNVDVGASQVQVGTQQSASIVSNLYNITLVVRDSRTGALAGASLNLTVGKYSFLGTTNRLGRYSFEGVANALYSLTVTVGTQTYFTGQVSANANNAVIAVTTTFVPQTTQLLIVILVAFVPVGLLVAYYVSRRLKRSQ